MIAKRNFQASCATLFVATISFATAVFAEQGDDNPTGVAGAFNGQITTGNSYDPYTGNMKREVNDIVVPGSIGAYPLKWTRYWNSHTNFRDTIRAGARWRFSYLDYYYSTDCLPGDAGVPVTFPDGRQITDGFGVEETHDSIDPIDLAKYGINAAGHRGEIIHLADGGQVILEGVPGGNCAFYYHAVQIRDPYQTVDPANTPATKLTWSGSPLKLDRITEPGGRYLKLTWDNTGLTKVEAFDGVNSQPIQSVTYHWVAGSGDARLPNPTSVIDYATYDDGTSAHYTYGDGLFLGPPHCTDNTARGHWHAAQLLTADDPHFGGPMRQIAYTYNTDINNQTRIASENHLLNGQVGEPVSTVAGIGRRGTTTATETRGDGATRTFNYNTVDLCRTNGDCPPPTPDTEPCHNEPGPKDGKLASFTDFLGHTTTLDYDDGGFINSVTDPNGHTTTYLHGPHGVVVKITHPDGSTIQQGFWDDTGYYLYSRTNELNKTTIYLRDANNRIYEKDYPRDADEPDSYETFTYNTFGEVLTHRLTNGGVESFVYDNTTGPPTRGLKTSWTDAAGGVTTYTYYTSGPWTDRLKTVTHPANASGFSAAETYEYDRDASGNAVAGRGLVTKVIHDDVANPGVHGDGTFVSTTYNQYGDKLSTTDELGHTTTFTYDEYGRPLTVTDPLNHTTTNSYVPTGQGSSYITTSNLPFATTLPSGKQTTFEYDFNWRKTAVHQAPNTADAATTRFVYDQGSARSDGSGNIGLLTSTIDPRNNTTMYTYDKRDRQNSITDPLMHTTGFAFDVHGNKTSEVHANGELIDFDQYDAMNRLRHQKVHRETTPTPIIDETFSTYDEAGNLATHKDENGYIYSYDYDGLNRPTVMHYPNGKMEVHAYDAAGNVKSYTNRLGAVQRFDYPNALDNSKTSYDKRNRQLYFAWSNEPTGTTHASAVTTVYDAGSRKTQLINDDATIVFQYLNDNKLQSQEEWVTAAGVGDNVHRTVTYTYDADGNRASIQYPSGAKFDYDYTQRNQVADIKLDGQLTPIVSYTFDPAGNIMGRTLDNNTSTAYTVDQANRDTSLVHSLTGGPKRFDYVYNSVNDITVVQRDLNKGDKYEYDLTQEIKRFAQNGNVDLNNGTITSPQADTNMTFDGCGNQKSLNGGGTFQVDTLNEYTNYNGAAVGNDINGNVQTYNGWTYTYDAQNRLRQAVSATVTENFYYDGLNRQVARVTSGGTTPPGPTPTPIPLVSPIPTISPLPTIPPIGITPTPTPAPTATPSATPTPTPKCSPVAFTDLNRQISMACPTPSGATIFYTTDETTPRHNNAAPVGTTQVYTGPVTVPNCQDTVFEAIAYKPGYIDSDLRTYTAKYSGGPSCGGFAPMSAQSSTVTVFSVWDGDWAILEEYTTGNVLVEKYLQGYHGLVKTFVQNVYYYQDELGSTSHIASGAGALIESYQYDVYGKPRVYDSGGTYQAGVTPVANFLQGGARWMPELGLYDDRNRFMSPDLGRFIQPDPIGFKGDASNLYRYCGNDWANKTDPMGLEVTAPGGLQSTELQNKELSSADRDWAAGSMMWDFEKRADSSGGNGSRDGRAARSDAFSTDVKAAIASGERLAQNGKGPTGVHYKEYDKWGKNGAGDAGAAEDYRQFRTHGENQTEYWGFIAQKDGVQSGHYIKGDSMPGNGVQGGMQTSSIPLNAKAFVPAGYHLIGYHTSHVLFDRSVLAKDGAAFARPANGPKPHGFGFQPKIAMMSPGENRDYDHPRMSYYPNPSGD